MRADDNNTTKFVLTTTATTEPPDDPEAALGRQLGALYLKLAAFRLPIVTPRERRTLQRRMAAVRRFLQAIEDQRLIGAQQAALAIQALNEDARHVAIREEAKARLRARSGRR